MGIQWGIYWLATQNKTERHTSVKCQVVESNRVTTCMHSHKWQYSATLCVRSSRLPLHWACVCLCVFEESVQGSRGMTLSGVTRWDADNHTHNCAHTHTHVWECLIGHCEPAGMLSSRGDGNQVITPTIWPSYCLCVCLAICAAGSGETHGTVIKAETKKRKERPSLMKTSQ